MCTGNVREMKSQFGIIKSPGFPSNPNGNRNVCFWAIFPKPNQMVDVTIHMAFSKEYTEVCSAQYLQVTYVDCNTRTKMTDAFCWANKVNIPRTSCGSVSIKSWSYLAGEDRGSRFLVSYQGKNGNKKS